jgi:pyruvate dehydrogenase E2 component (dihydrolipoamide acetyltransferase)
MATAIVLPELGNTVEACHITRWVKVKGDVVAAGEVVAEIETDKTTFEITAPVDGTLLEAFFDEGALVPVFTNLCVIGELGENIDAFRPELAGLSAEARLDNSGRAKVERAKVGAAGLATVRRPANAGGAEVGLSTVARLEHSGRAEVGISPRALKYAARHSIQLASVAGSGPKGRVLERDVRLAHEASQQVSSSSPLSNTRDIIARRMRESFAATAQYTLHGSADATGLLQLRQRCKQSSDVRDVTINDLVMFCAIRALRETPELNVTFVDGRLVKHSNIHLAFACDTPRGLVAPVIRDADDRSIRELAAETRELTAQAVAGTIAPAHLSGATFTISNLGGLGVESFTPLVNPPQVAILGIGSIQLKPVRKEGQVAFIDAIGLSLTCDHQIIDGAPGARFLQTVAQKIETVEALCAI